MRRRKYLLVGLAIVMLAVGPMLVQYWRTHTVEIDLRGPVNQTVHCSYTVDGDETKFVGKLPLRFTVTGREIRLGVAKTGWEGHLEIRATIDGREERPRPLETPGGRWGLSRDDEGRWVRTIAD